MSEAPNPVSPIVFTIAASGQLQRTIADCPGAKSGAASDQKRSQVSYMQNLPKQLYIQHTLLGNLFPCHKSGTQISLPSSRICIGHTRTVSMLCRPFSVSEPCCLTTHAFDPSNNLNGLKLSGNAKEWSFPLSHQVQIDRPHTV